MAYLSKARWPNISDVASPSKLTYSLQYTLFFNHKNVMPILHSFIFQVVSNSMQYECKKKWYICLVQLHVDLRREFFAAIWCPLMDDVTKVVPSSCIIPLPEDITRSIHRTVFY